jgi:hypothetical protein
MSYMSYMITQVGGAEHSCNDVTYLTHVTNLG